METLLTYPIKAIRVFDNDEYALFRLQRKVRNPKIRAFLGDIRDRKRLQLALQDVDVVFHLAAIKNIEISEYNCPECVRTNVDGTINLVECSFITKPKLFIYISSDKAVDFSSLYGATKFLGEKITLWADRVSNKTRYTCIRFGNVMDSRGNVFEVWQNQLNRNEPLTVTSPKAKRFFFTKKEAIDFITKATEASEGGEIWVPEMKEYSILELAKRKSDNIKFTGLRKNEKICETLMSLSERKHARYYEGIGWVIK